VIAKIPESCQEIPFSPQSNRALGKYNTLPYYLTRYLTIRNFLECETDFAERVEPVVFSPRSWQPGEGIAFPMGTMDTFVTYGAPANLIETVNTMGGW